MDLLRQAIAATVARRAAFKADMDAWCGGAGRGRCPGREALAALDLDLSDRDTRFKHLSDIGDAAGLLETPVLRA
jgi:hypothetical protein